MQASVGNNPQKMYTKLKERTLNPFLETIHKITKNFNASSNFYKQNYHLATQQQNAELIINFVENMFMTT